MGCPGPSHELEQNMAPRTLSQKLWDAHVVHRSDGEPDVLYIDLHLVHEVTSPQAFDGLRINGRSCLLYTSPSPRD